MVKAVKLSISLAVVCLLVAFGVSSAQADQINFGPSAQNEVFTATSTTAMTIALGSTGNSTGGCLIADFCLSGPAAFGHDSGDFSLNTTGLLGATSPFIPSTTTFPVQMMGQTSTFNYMGTDGDTLIGTIDFTGLNDGSPHPDMQGILTITTVTGDSDFTSVYAALGGLTTIDFDTSTLGCSFAGTCTVQATFAAGAGATAHAPTSAGEVDTPEPASLMLFGTGLLGFAFLLRRKKLFA